MNKTAAAEYLGISVRSLERYTSEGRIVAGKVRGKTGPVSDYDEDHLESFKLDLETPTSAVIVPPTFAKTPEMTRLDNKLATLNATLSPLLESVRPQTSTLSILEKVAPSLANKPTNPAKEPTDTRQVAPKLLWTLDEASSMTGLSRARLRTAIEEGKLKAGRVGRAFRVRPDDVHSFVAELF